MAKASGSKTPALRAASLTFVCLNGTVKKGKKRWNSSKSYLKIRNSKANKDRKLAGHRKSLHGEWVTTEVFKNISKSQDAVVATLPEPGIRYRSKQTPCF